MRASGSLWNSAESFSYRRIFYSCVVHGQLLTQTSTIKCKQDLPWKKCGVVSVWFENLETQPTQPNAKAKKTHRRGDHGIKSVLTTKKRVVSPHLAFSKGSCLAWSPCRPKRSRSWDSGFNEAVSCLQLLFRVECIFRNFKLSFATKTLSPFFCPHEGRFSQYLFVRAVHLRTAALPPCYQIDSFN